MCCFHSPHFKLPDPSAEPVHVHAEVKVETVQQITHSSRRSSSTAHAETVPETATTPAASAAAADSVSQASFVSRNDSSDGEIRWTDPKEVVLQRGKMGQPLGISIVGGKVSISGVKDGIPGIFIKQILPNSVAERCGQLKTGDRILEVDGVDLRSASHDYAVDVIRKTGINVNLVVQSLRDQPEVRYIDKPISGSSMQTSQISSSETETTKESSPQLAPAMQKQPRNLLASSDSIPFVEDMVSSDDEDLKKARSRFQELASTASSPEQNIHLDLRVVKIPRSALGSIDMSNMLDLGKHGGLVIRSVPVGCTSLLPGDEIL